MKQIEKDVCRNDFGKFIYNGRTRKNITQAEAASLVGVTQQHLSLIELGRRDIDLSFAIELCNALGLDLRDFVVEYI